MNEGLQQSSTTGPLLHCGGGMDLHIIHPDTPTTVKLIESDVSLKPVKPLT